MGGKGGGGQQYYVPPPNTSGNATLEEAEKTLAATKPLDMSGYQQNIDVKKAAADATAPKTEDTSKPDNSLPTESTSGTSTTTEGTGDVIKRAVLTPPGFWADYGKAVQTDPTTTTTQV